MSQSAIIDTKHRFEQLFFLIWVILKLYSVLRYLHYHSTFLHQLTRFLTNMPFQLSFNLGITRYHDGYVQDVKTESRLLSANNFLFHQPCQSTVLVKNQRDHGKHILCFLTLWYLCVFVVIISRQSPSGYEKRSISSIVSWCSSAACPLSNKPCPIQRSIFV